MVISLWTPASSVALSSVRTFRVIVVISIFITAGVVGLVVVLGVILATVAPVVISLI